MYWYPKEFYVYSSDTDITLRDIRYNWCSHATAVPATLVFCKKCNQPGYKCAIIQYLIKQGAKERSIDFLCNQQHLFNFPPQIDIEKIRKAVNTANNLCYHCKNNPGRI